MKFLITTFFISLSLLASGQMVISSGTTFAAASGTTIVTTGSIDNQSSRTDLKNADLVLAAGANSTISTINANPISLNSLTVKSQAPYTVTGEWSILNDLTLTSGILTITGGKLTYEGGTDLAGTGNDNSYVNGPLFIKSGTQRTFPIGNNGYFPAQLQNISAADRDTPLAFEVIPTDPGFTKSTGINEIFKDHFWRLTIDNSASALTGNQSAQVSLSANGVNLTSNGAYVVLEKDQSGKQNDLGGSDNLPFYTSSSPISSTGKQYTLAKGDVIAVRVHKLITPDNDGKNDVLYIENIDLFPGNEVTILDRWGVPFFSKKSFVNYPEPASSSQPQDGVDFRNLAIGNYICVVKYTDKGAPVSIKQMISVLK
jgi:hypothetical protein